MKLEQQVPVIFILLLTLSILIIFLDTISSKGEKKEEKEDTIRPNLGFEYLCNNAIAQEIPFMGYCYQRHNFYTIKTKYGEAIVGVASRMYSFEDDLDSVWVFCATVDGKTFLIDRRWNDPTLYCEGASLDSLQRLYGKYDKDLYKTIAKDVKEGRTIECELNTSRIKSNIEKKLQVTKI